jgi:hypothetical protein
MNEAIYFTIAAILLYVAADKILITVERLRGGHFKNRSMIFFAIIMFLALGTFQILQHFLPKKDVAPAAEATSQPQDAAIPSQTQETATPEEVPAEVPRVSTPPRVE